MRREIPLNFNWRFAKYEEALINANYDDSHLELVNIPHQNVDLPFNYFSEDEYQFESVYRRKIDLEKNLNKRYFINFEGVAHYAKIYVNDIYIGDHKGGYTPFEFEITKALKNGVNQLVVYVDSRETLNIPPFGKVIDYLTFGGIYREVTLIETPLNYIKDITIKYENVLRLPKLTFDISHEGGKTLEINLFKDNEKKLAKSFNIESEITLEYDFDLWDVDNPNLYTFEFILNNEDKYSIRTGIKHGEFKTDGFYLNGKKTKIIGLNRHQIYPYVGYAMPKRAQESDAILLKELGNAARTSHYPQSRHFMNMCDELGLLVFTEAPGWQYVGDLEWQDIYAENVREMVKYYKHHPSIILWGARVNESGDYTELYTKTNEIVRSMDQRETGGVRDFSNSEFLEDVYTYNDFQFNGNNRYTKPVDEVINHDAPYMITEYVGHMFPTKSFDNSARRDEHALRHAHILDSYIGNERTAGGYGWHFVDYYTHQEFGSGDRICYHGVKDIFRLDKSAAKVYKSQFTKDAFLEVLNANDLGDYNSGHLDTFYIASNCDYIDVYQDERYVGKFYPRKDIFKNLKHPLYIIDDLYGNVYEEIGISKEESQEYVAMAHEIAKRGGTEKIEKTDNFNQAKFKIAWDMYGKYIANWGSNTFKYTFVGRYQDEEIKRVIKPGHKYRYDVTVDTNVLKHDATYDVAKIDIIARDENGNIRPYLNDALVLETEGDIEIIGQKIISLIGGQRSIWIKSLKKGNGTLKMYNDRFNHLIKFIIK